MSYITSSNGKKIWYDIVGDGEPLVLVGGSSLVHRQWDFLSPLLQDHFKVILYDQRGAGQDRLANDLRFLMFWDGTISLMAPILRRSMDALLLCFFLWNISWPQSACQFRYSW